MDFGKIGIKFVPLTKMVLVDKEYIAKIDEGCYFAYIYELTNDNFPNLFIKKENGIFQIDEIIRYDDVPRSRHRKYDYQGNLLSMEWGGEDE